MFSDKQTLFPEKAFSILFSGNSFSSIANALTASAAMQIITICPGARLTVEISPCLFCGVDLRSGAGNIFYLFHDPVLQLLAQLRVGGQQSFGLIASLTELFSFKTEP